jgi:hypothetical protein
MRDLSNGFSCGGIRVESSDLAFFTTEELIAELMSRQTFLGVVVNSEVEWKGNVWGEERTFSVHLNSNLDTARASKLLSRISDFIGLNHC